MRQKPRDAQVHVYSNLEVGVFEFAKAIQDEGL